MSEFTHDEQTLIENVAKQNGFRSFEIKLKGTTSKGDNYLGIVKFIQIKDKNSETTLDLVLKTAHSSETLRKQMPLANAYLREIFMYESIFSEFLSFQEKKKIPHPFKGVAKLYGCSDKSGSESLLLEDLRASGYKLWNRKVPMNPEHVAIVLKEYARYHAISFAFKHFYPEKFTNLANNLKDIFEGDSMPDKDKFAAMMEKQFEKGYLALGGHPASEALKALQENVVEFVFDQIQSEENKLVVIHGDCWCNNIMFKYEDKLDPRNPTSIRLLDFQLSKMGSPVMDLAYFIYVCADKDIFRELPVYQDLYYKVLSENIRGFGCDPEELYPFHLFMSQWKTFAKTGLFSAFTVLPLMLSDSEDAIDIAEIADSGKSIWEEFSKKTVIKENEDNFHARLSDIIISMFESKLL